jgi:hypothetical protein
MPTIRSGLLFWAASSNLAFEAEVLLYGLEREVAISRTVEVGDPGDPRQDGFLLGTSECEALDRVIERTFELPPGALDGLWRDLFQVDVDAFLGHFCGQRPPHHASANDRHAVQFPTHARECTR